MAVRILNGMVVVGLVLVLQACSDRMDALRERETLNEQQIQAWIEVWNSRDFNQIDGIYAPDGVYEDVPDQSANSGREEIKDFLRECATWAPDIKVELKSMMVSGDLGAATWVWSGTQTGDIPGLMPASGNSFSIRGVTIYQFEDGMITKSSDYYDAGGFLYQLGVGFEFPEPAGE